MIAKFVKTALLLILVLFFCGYNEQITLDIAVDNYEPYVSEKPATVSFTQVFYTNSDGYFADYDSTLCSRLSAIYNELLDKERVYPEHVDETLIQFYAAPDGISVSRVRSGNDFYICIDDCNFYADNKELVKLTAELEESSGEFYDGYTYEYNTQPFRSEYTYVAEEYMKQILDDYVKNGKLESYEMGDIFFSKEGRCGDRLEYVVEICFNVTATQEPNVFDLKYYQQGRYTAAGHHWSGNYICARFCCENGVNRMIEAGTRDDYDRIIRGLYGINEDTEIITFNEASRDEFFNVHLPKEDYPNADAMALTTTSSGEWYYIIIDDDGDLVLDGNNKPTYSSPIYYSDDYGAVDVTFDQPFELLFEDVNCDGNPDFCLRYAYEDGYSKYCINTLQDDGRLFDIGEFYLEGDLPPVIKPQMLGEGYFCFYIEKTDSYLYETAGAHDIDGRPEEIGEPDAFRMYSERYYLPGNVKYYFEHENTVYFTLWNNTSQNATTSGEYYIERQNGEQWERVSDTFSYTPAALDAHDFTSVPFDISSLQNRERGEYRIVTEAAGKKLYGAFMLDGSSVPEIEIGAFTNQATRTELTFGIRNIGNDTLILKNPLVIEKDGAKIAGFTARQDRIYAGEAINIGCNGEFEAGDYTLLVTAGGKKFEESFTLDFEEAQNLPISAMKVKSAEYVSSSDRFDVTITASQKLLPADYIFRLYVDDGYRWIETYYTLRVNFASGKYLFPDTSRTLEISQPSYLLSGYDGDKLNRGDRCMLVYGDKELLDWHYYYFTA